MVGRLVGCWTARCNFKPAEIIRTGGDLGINLYLLRLGWMIVNPDAGG